MHSTSSPGAQLDRLGRLDAFFADEHSGDLYDTDAITSVMACSSLLPAGLIGDAGAV